MVSRRAYVFLYVATLVAVGASVIVGPAISGEIQLVPNSFVNPAGNSSPSGSVTSGNGSDSFHWNNAAFSLIGSNLVKISVQTECSSFGEPCDKVAFSGDPLIFSGQFTGSGFDTALDTLQLSLTGTHTGTMNVDLSLLLEDTDTSGPQASVSLSYQNTGSPINLFSEPLLAPFENFIATLSLTFHENTGTSNLSDSGDVLFDFPPTAGVPEPASVVLFAGGLGLLALLRRKIRTA